jgi:dienelactone hydrolase
MARDESPGGDERPGELEEEEPPQVFDPRDDAEDDRAEQVQDQVRVRPLIDDPELAERVSDEDRHGAGYLDRLAHTPVMPKRIGLVLVLVLLLTGCGGDSKPEASGPFDYDRDASLEFKDKGRVNRNYPIEIRDVSYASPGGDDEVTAFLVKPPGQGPFPGVILVHGAGGNRQQLLVQATWLAGRGAVALVVDSPFARNPGLQFPEGIPGLRVERDLIVKNVQELRRAVDVLKEHAGVEDEKIGYIGYSAGARTGAILAGNEDRVDAYVFISGGSAPIAEVTKAVPPDVRSDVEVILTEVDPLRHVREAPPAKLLFQNGRKDEVVPRAALLALYRAAGKPKEIRWYDATHEPTVAVYRDTLSWLTKELGLSTRPVVPRAKIGP